MNNLLPSTITMHQMYDLKGSTYKRKVSLIHLMYSYLDIIIERVEVSLESCTVGPAICAREPIAKDLSKM